MKYLAITAILCLILAGVSFAGNVTMTDVITGGNLTLTMPNAFSLSGVTIGGSSAQNATSNATYTVEDSRGTGAGWNLGFQIGQFTTGGTAAKTIAISKSEMSIAPENITCIWGQAVEDIGGHGPETCMAVPYIIGGVNEVGVTSATDHGMGKYATQANHTLTVNAYVYAGTYTATLTATLNAVP